MRIRFNKFFLGVFMPVLFLTTSCKDTDARLVDIEKVKVPYVESAADFPNPERGFYRYSETYASRFTQLNADELKGYRNTQTVEGAGYQVTSTLVFRYYILDNATGGPIAPAFLTNMEKDMVAARTAGVKLIPRFVYTVTQKSGDCPEGFICPPYGDAAKAVVLAHIAQLKPVLQANADVIACVQLGFIGTWGEQYYSDFFGDASGNGKQENRLSNQNWLDRAEVLRAMLDAVPADRTVQVRYPQIKQRFLYGVTAPISSAALTDAEGFTNADRARIGYHNDCFLASTNDLGTYEDYGNSTSPRTSSGSVINALRGYMSDDSKYVAVGGETCSDDYSPANDCEPAGKAQQEFATMHYSYLNAHYNNNVNNDWQTGGCMDNIKRNLGYRFVLLNGVYPDQVVRGTSMTIVINLKNAGYASPFNKRTAKLLLRNKQNNEVFSFDLASDVRKWFSGNHQIQESIKVPADLAPGDYELLLNLPDVYESLATRAEYSIRLANEDVWEEATGYNKLNHTVKVN
ncbi:MAG: DUF4832 domain-containing protein [Arcticibacter sp.]